MSADVIPSLAEFLAAPVEEVAQVAPATLIYGGGGTRRRAVFEGIEPWSDEFVTWTRKELMDRIDTLFRHGVRNVVITTLTPDNFREVNRYHDRLIERTKWFIAGTEALADYAQLGWRVRLIGAESLPTLRETVSELRTATGTDGCHTLYWNIVPDLESPWQQLLTAAQQAQTTSRAEVVRALYGEEIPPASLYLAFGKPTFLPDIIPPLLLGPMQCYWSQKPGYSFTEAELRTILYDYAYLRPTWQSEKLERANEAVTHRQAWEEGPTLGLGMRLGAFWYPAPMSSPAWPSIPTE